LSTVPGLGYSVAELGIGTEVVGRNKQGEPIDKRKKPIFAGEVFPSNDKLLRHLRLHLWICQQFNRKLKPKPNADDRRLAVRAALILGEAQGIRLVTTKRGKLCRLSAALLGDRDADMQPHCRAVMKQWAEEKHQRKLAKEELRRKTGANPGV
jgi:hypothetical protein